jgi:hypothetical protein
MAYTAEQLSQALWDTLKSDPNASYDDVAKAAATYGIDLAGVGKAYQDVGNQAFQTQFGRDAVGREASDALYYLTHEGGLDQGQTILNNSQEGYNYDTNDLVAAYRETFGRNPTQEEYVQAMATLGVNNFDQSTLGKSGQYTAATVAALESDPYAGRYAGYNPYDLPADAANVSTNTLGDQVQYISPITQRPVVANFNNGDLELAAGLDVLTPQQIQSAIGLATATGGLTPEARTTMLDSIRNSKTTNDLYAAFSAPQAVAALGANGAQVGVGQTEALARENGFNGMDSNGLKNAYDTLYKGAAPYTLSDTIGAGKKATPLDIRTTINNAINSTQLGAQKGLDALSANMPEQKFTNFGTFGIAGADRLGAGSADYQSDLIESLRTADDSLKSNNNGVNKWGYLGSGPDSQPFGSMSPDAAFDPKIFTQTPATAKDISDWNSYNTFRTNSLTEKTPVVSYEEWLAGGKSDGKAAVNVVNKIAGSTDDYSMGGTGL